MSFVSTRVRAHFIRAIVVFANLHCATTAFAGFCNASGAQEPRHEFQFLGRYGNTMCGS